MVVILLLCIVAAPLFHHEGVTQEPVSTEFGIPSPTVPPRAVTGTPVSLKEAQEILGTEFPLPKYLPKGFELKRVLLLGKNIVYLIYSDKEVSNETNLLKVLKEGKIEIILQKVRPEYFPSENIAEMLARDVGGSVISFGEIKAWAIVDVRNNWFIIKWWDRDRLLRISVGTDPSISHEETVKVAYSMMRGS